MSFYQFGVLGGCDEQEAFFEVYRGYIVGGFGLFVIVVLFVYVY